jgi:aryl-alcohol dehydrogenase-like predicted oxidoreductase
MNTPRRIGDREVSALGFGCWAIGGPFSDPDGKPLGWGEVDDDESIAAIRRAMELGVTFFDTADVYGAGHSERVLGRAIAGHRDEVAIASKWGNVFDENTKVRTHADNSVEYLNKAIRASLRRLGTDHLDLYQLHSAPTVEEAEPLADAAEELVKEGLIRGYAWSTDDPRRAAAWVGRPGYVAIQHECSVLHDAPELIDLCERHNLASVNRTPLAMGLLGRRDHTRPTTGADIRSAAPEWLRFFENGVPTPEWARTVDSLREILTTDGRTLAQGALAWLLARSDHTIPIPGFRNVTQVEDNAGVLTHGPLTQEQLKEIKTLQEAA